MVRWSRCHLHRLEFEGRGLEHLLRGFSIELEGWRAFGARPRVHQARRSRASPVPPRPSARVVETAEGSGGGQTALISQLMATVKTLSEQVEALTARGRAGRSTSRDSRRSAEGIHPERGYPVSRCASCSPRRRRSTRSS